MEIETTEMSNSEADEFAEMVSTIDAEKSAAVVDKTGTCLTKQGVDGLLHKLVAKGLKNRRIPAGTVKELMDQGIHANISKFHQYTVVELIFAGCRYHGLASMHIGDEPNDMMGTGLAYSRAFDQLLAKNQKNAKRLQQSTPQASMIEIAMGGN